MKSRKKTQTLAIFVATAMLCAAQVSWAQTSRLVAADVQGRVLDFDGKPLANATVTYTNMDTGFTYNMKTDADGRFSQINLQRGNYQVELTGPEGDRLYRMRTTLKDNQDPDSASFNKLEIDLSKFEKKGMTRKEVAAVEAENAKIASSNDQLAQAKAALEAGRWAELEAEVRKLLDANPDHFEYQRALGDALYHQGKYDDAIMAYQDARKGVDKAIDAQKKWAATHTGTAIEINRLKSTIGDLLVAEGNAELKLHKENLALSAYKEATEISPAPAIPYFNICAVRYNADEMQAAMSACSKAISADSHLAEPYFVKGAALFATGKLDASKKYVAPPETAKLLTKYLELAPQGPHADEAASMMATLGAHIETSYKGKK